MSVVKVNWSGGKDSTCAVYLHAEKGDTVKAVCYIPLFVENIPLISKAHFDFIYDTAERFNKAGIITYIVHGITFYEYVHHIAMRGKYKGLPFGFPYIASGMCGFKRDSKLKALTMLNVGAYDYEDIGIAYDETRRRSQLNQKRRSILYEYKITETQAKEICAQIGLLSPIYETGRRDGCILCPNAKDQEIEHWLIDYPEALPILKRLQEFVKEARPDREPPRRGYKWYI